AAANVLVVSCPVAPLGAAPAHYRRGGVSCGPGAGVLPPKLPGGPILSRCPGLAAFSVRINFLRVGGGNSPRTPPARVGRGRGLAVVSIIPGPLTLPSPLRGGRG